MNCLPREVLKWLQSLDLSHPVRNPRRDFCNGFLVAEIIGWYFPRAVHVNTFVDGQSLGHRLGNWQQLEKERIEISKELIESTLHCKAGAAEALVNVLFTTLTNRSLPAVSCREAVETVDSGNFTDSAYQAKLPSYARSTASQAIKNNLTITELAAEPDHVAGQHKVEMILVNHLQQRRIERTMEPERFVARTGKSNQRSSSSVHQENTLRKTGMRQRVTQRPVSENTTTAPPTADVPLIKVNQPGNDDRET